MIRKAFAAVFGHFRLKLFALLISLGIWFYANSRLTEVRTILAPVDLAPPAGYDLLYQSDPAARVEVSGPNWLMARLEDAVSGRFLKLSHAIAEGEIAGGWADLRIDYDWLQGTLPEEEFAQISFRGVQPNRIRAFLSPRVEVTLPVEVKTSGELASGYHLSQAPQAAPGQVTATGPALAFGTISAIPTETIPIWNLRSDLRREVALKKEVEVTLDNNRRVTVRLILSVPTVVANIYVSGQKEQEQAFGGVPVRLLTPAGFPYAASFLGGETTVSVTVRAAPEELKRLTAGAIIAYVDLSSLASESIPLGGSAPYTEEVLARLPEDVEGTIVRIEPPRVSLLLKRPEEQLQ